jgi:hypothetical protein
MAHSQQIDFCQKVRLNFPSHFKDVRVLDAGSQDINGNNRYLFENCNYLGIDLGEGPNVDLVCAMHEHEPEEKYDTIISTEAFEHDKNFKESVRHIVYSLLKSGGLFLMTCAAHGRPEHGTHNHSFVDSPFTLDFYKNRGPKDFAEALDLEEVFYKYGFEYNGDSHDLYFWGLKH